MRIFEKAGKLLGMQQPTRPAIRQIQIAALELQQKEFISRPWVAEQISQELGKKTGAMFIRLVESGRDLNSIEEVNKKINLSGKVTNQLGRFLVREGYVSYGVPLRPLVEDESLFFPFVNKVVTGDYKISSSNFREIQSLQGIYDALYFTSRGSVERRILGLVTDRKRYSTTERGDLDTRSIAFEIFRQKNGGNDVYIRSGVFSAVKNMSLILLGGGNAKSFLYERRVTELFSEELYTSIFSTDGYGLNVVSLQSGLDGTEFEGNFQYMNRGGKVVFLRQENSSLPISKSDLNKLGFFDVPDLKINERDSVERLRQTFPTSEVEHNRFIQKPVESGAR